ncbi:asparagine synthase [Emticicia oligotrophica DSM 17448]|uniref:asparagine synthase (glutamine-hydrolyzing) n=1 Tax=Emticicia oligotrophica (strain DSM 17448 / CIP 109782 / MTCC 6937 / GPTSA100-15) TaxID=929562 RepID=A0ABM5MZ11_EMTOG|nr:asparagine synthase-related protein [Emticicia oligotrophica]AFK02410.1 asparagine synthase [Emticicia oligotrophica DSM 17448]
MSLLYGIFDKNLNNVVPKMEEMYRGIQHLPHVKHQFFAKDYFSTGHLLTYNTPESLFEVQPQFLSEQQIIFTSTGRLDNREDLAKRLDLKLHAQLSDGELIKKAYLKWGKESPRYLRGDWSFVCYHILEEELFLARDHHGYTSLYYFLDGEQFAFSSSAKAIFALKSFTKEINVEVFVKKLIIWKFDEIKGQLSYKNLNCLPPAHTLTFKNGQISLQRYWFPENVSLRLYKKPTLYAEELREIFQEAVRVRLRSYKPVSSMLSGGFDSSSVTSMAASILAKEGKRLTTFSHIPFYKEKVAQENFEHYFPDESKNILATAQHAGNIDPILLTSENISPIEGFIKAFDNDDNLFHAACNAFWLVDLSAQAAKNGFGTLLSGEMGNATISYTGLDYLLPINHSVYLKNPIQLLKRIVKPLLIKHYPTYYASKNKTLLSYIDKNYLSENILKEWHIIEDINNNNRNFIPYFPTSKAGMLRILDIGNNPRCLSGAVDGHTHGFEYRDPTGDVNVIEYCLSIPNHAFFDKNLNTKDIFKTMMNGILPDQVLFEKKKGLQASDVRHRVLNDKTRVNDLLSQLEQSSQVKELINTTKLKQNWQRIQTEEITNILDIQTFVKGLMFGYFVWKKN